MIISFYALMFLWLCKVHAMCWSKILEIEKIENWVFGTPSRTPDGNLFGRMVKNFRATVRGRSAADEKKPCLRRLIL